ncbi:MAG: class II aldolase/adducin family protein [Spirochaetaceae bacterium]|nr:class II aldolase/adducin family protein [Spirochaetaceae bacterium]
MADSGKRMLNSGLTVETWGNISARDPDSGLIYLTPSAMGYDVICEDDIVTAGIDVSIAEGKRSPVVEFELHPGIYRSRPEINAIVHTHPVYSQIFGVLRGPIPALIGEAAQARTIGTPCLLEQIRIDYMSGFALHRYGR